MWLDLLTGTVLVIAILQGYKNGLISAVVSFMSLFIGLVLAFQFAGFVARQLKEHTKIASHFLPFISFFIILIYDINLFIINKKFFVTLRKITFSYFNRMTSR